MILDPNVSTFILFMDTTYPNPDPEVVEDWDTNSGLINPRKDELAAYNYLNSFKPTLVVYVKDHFDAYDHTDPTVAKADCICNLPDYNIPGWPKFYSKWKFVAAGVRDILTLDLSRVES
jgi:hypothetical protein